MSDIVFAYVILTGPTLQPKKKTMETGILTQENEIRSQKKGRNAATVGGIFLLILLLIPIFFYQDPPPGQPGILVNLGLPDQGQGDENAGPSTPAASTPEPTPPPPSQPETQPEPQPTQPQPQPTPPVVQQEDPSEVALREQRERQQREQDAADQRRREQEATERRQQQEEADRRAREAAAEAERQRQAEEARRRQEAEAAATRDQIGGLFGSGNGRGETGTPGNQGDPDGDPDADRLTGISTGSGNVSGLGGRKVTAAPPVQEKTQSAGTVVIEICVGSNGRVSSATFSNRGSAAATPQLIAVAKANAMKYRFESNTLDKQCGKITYNFRVQ